MAKLNFSLDGKSLGEFALDKERITIGRRPTNDIHIDNLAVSGEHAMILTLGADSFLEDLNSTNGTMVNKKMIKKHVLQHNDVVEFGKYQLKYLAENLTKSVPNGGSIKTEQDKKTEKQNVEPVPSPPPIDKSAVVKTESIAESAPAIEAPSAETKVQTITSGAAKAHLLILNGNNSGQEMLLNRAMVKLGTAGEQLAVITKRPNGYFVSHVEGNERPLVNGQSIGMQARALIDHDVIEVSGIKMEIFLV